MRIHVGLLVFTLLPLALFAEQFSGGTYISPDHSFELKIPLGYEIQTGKDKRSGSYLAVCHSASLLCVTLPPALYKGTTFGAASVEVMLLPAGTEQVCLAGGKSPDPRFHANAQNPASPKMIGGTRFMHSSSSDAAMNHEITTDTYRGYVHGKCYQLALQITSTNFSVYPAGAIKEFTLRDRDRVRRDLMQIVDSFRSPPQSH